MARSVFIDVQRIREMAAPDLAMSEEERQRCESDGARIRDIDQYSSLVTPQRFKARGASARILDTTGHLATSSFPLQRFRYRRHGHREPGLVRL